MYRNNLMQKLRIKHSTTPALKQAPSRLNRSTNSYESLHPKPAKSPPSKRHVFELPSNKQNHSITISEFSTTHNFKESVRVSLVELEDMRRSYSNVCDERRRYIDIIDWLKVTLSEASDKMESGGNPGELKNIFSTAIGEMIKESRVENNERARLLRLSWEAVMNLSTHQIKTLQTRLSNIQTQIYNKHKLQREQYDREIKQYRDRIIQNAADLAQKQRFFYQVVTDNRILRNRMKKLMNRLKHQLQSNSYLKEQNMIFYKQNEKMKMVLDSEDLDSKYRVLQQKFQALEKEFQLQKKRITRVNIIKELDEDQMRRELGIKEEVDMIIRRVDVDDLLDLEIVETPKVEELARLYYSAGIQTEAVTHDRSTNTPSVFLGKKGVAIQCGGFERSKYFSYYRCEDILHESSVDTLGGEVLRAYREKNMQLRGDIRMREQMERNRGGVSQERSFKKIIVSPPNQPVARELTRTKSRKRTVSPSRFIQAASQFVNRLMDPNKDEIKSRTSQASRRSQIVENRVEQNIVKHTVLRRSTQRTTQLLNPMRASIKKNSAIFGESPRKSNLTKMLKIDNAMIQQSLLKYSPNEQPSLQQSQSKINEAQSQAEFYQETQTFRLSKKNSNSETQKMKYPSQRSSYFQDQFMIDVSAPDTVKNTSINTSLVSKGNEKEIRRSAAKPEIEDKLRMRKSSHRKSMTAESIQVEEREIKRKSNKNQKQAEGGRKDYQSSLEVQISNVQEKQKLQKEKERQKQKQKQGESQKGGVQSQGKAKVQLPSITARLSEAPTVRVRPANFNKIEQRQSQSQISSNLSFCNTIEPKKISIPQQRRYSRFSSLNIDRNNHTSNLQELSKFEMSLIKNEIESVDELPPAVEVPESLLRRTMNTATKQIFKHRESIIQHEIIFEEFLDSIIDRAYGVGTLSVDVKSKVKSSLFLYEGENREKLSFKCLLEGKPDESDYKRYLFVLYTLCSEFWKLYSSSDNFMDLLADFIQDLLSNFCSTTLINNFIKNSIITKSVTSENELFLSLKVFVDTESSHLHFTQTLYKLRLSHNKKNTIFLRDFYQIAQLIEPNPQFLSLKFREIAQYCNKGTHRIPVFKLILLLKKLGWSNALNLEQSLKIKYFDRYKGSTSKEVEQEIKHLSLSTSNNKYLNALLAVKGQETKEANIMLFYLVKLQHSTQVISQIYDEMMGPDLGVMTQLFTNIVQQTVFGK